LVFNGPFLLKIVAKVILENLMIATRPMATSGMAGAMPITPNCAPKSTIASNVQAAGVCPPAAG
jgi:hypothetical protein